MGEWSLGFNGEALPLVGVREWFLFSNCLTDVALFLVFFAFVSSKWPKLVWWISYARKPPHHWTKHDNDVAARRFFVSSRLSLLLDSSSSSPPPPPPLRPRLCSRGLSAKQSVPKLGQSFLHFCFFSFLPMRSFLSPKCLSLVYKTKKNHKKTSTTVSYAPYWTETSIFPHAVDAEDQHWSKVISFHRAFQCKRNLSFQQSDNSGVSDDLSQLLISFLGRRRRKKNFCFPLSEYFIPNLRCLVCIYIFCSEDFCCLTIITLLTRVFFKNLFSPF